MTICKYGDPVCPCQDGDPCHYEPHGDTPAMHVAPESVLRAVAAEREAGAKIAIDHAEFCRKEFHSGGHESLDERASGAAWIAELIRRRS